MRARIDLAREVPRAVSGALALAALATLLVFEKRRPLRPRTESRIRRNARNLAFATLSGLATSKAEKPIVLGLARLVQRRRWGLLKRVRLPAWLEVAAAVVLLDYTLYVWHVLTHRSRFLWRFHAVHHADLDLSATTALRFHFGEMLLSIPWRAAQVLVVGASPFSLTAWQTATLLAILFHHSDIELPLDVEMRLSRLVMTPRLHGIHHSILLEETDSNWSTIFTWPDSLHGTARTVRLAAPGEVTIGIPSPRDASELTLPRLVLMPLSAQRASRNRTRTQPVRSASCRRRTPRATE
jgi:sterol desaturase/sphingolipid hydroxylase (fatty acid hydroxylase superfamily)